MKTLTKDLMEKNLITMQPDDSMLDAYKIMIEKNIRHLPVVKAGKLVGILSDRDVLKAMHSNKIDEVKMEFILNSSHKINDFMTWPVYTVSETTSIEKVLEEILLQKVNAFMVENAKGEMKGIITTQDLMGYLMIILKKNNQEKAAPFLNRFLPL
jgi:acetoin utilization protein AcuB